MCSVAQSCPTLCDPIDCSPLSSYVHGIFQAMILEGVAISFSGESSQHREQTCISLHLLHWQAGSLPLMSPGNPGAASVVKTKSNMTHKVLPDTHTTHTHTHLHCHCEISQEWSYAKMKTISLFISFHFELIYDQFSSIPFFIC